MLSFLWFVKQLFYFRTSISTSVEKLFDSDASSNRNSNASSRRVSNDLNLPLQQSFPSEVWKFFWLLKILSRIKCYQILKFSFKKKEKKALPTFLIFFSSISNYIFKTQHTPGKLYKWFVQDYLNFRWCNQQYGGTETFLID